MIPIIKNHSQLSAFVNELYPNFTYIDCPYCLCFWAANSQFPEAIASARKNRDDHIDKFHEGGGDER